MALSAARLNAASIFSKSIPHGFSIRVIMAHLSMDARGKPGRDGGEYASDFACTARTVLTNVERDLREVDIFASRFFGRV